MRFLIVEAAKATSFMVGELSGGQLGIASLLHFA